jgi:hypothetical protein
MNEEALGRLRSLDWEELSAKLMLSAQTLAVRYGWGRDSSLPCGMSLEDVTIEAICDIWTDPDRLKPGIEVFVQLRGIVRSKLWNLSQSLDEKVVRSDELSETASVSEGGIANFDTTDEFERALELLSESPRVKGNAELELVVLAMSCGAMEMDELVLETQLTRDRIYQLRRELRQTYLTIATRLGK